MRTRRVDAQDDGKVWFVIDDIPPGSPLAQGAIEMEFVEFGGGYGRAFASSSWFLDEAYAGFAAHGPSMLEHHVAGGAKRWEDALETTIRRADSIGVRTFVVGSAAIAVHGGLVTPGDVDLVVSDDDARRLGEALLDLLVEPVTPTANWVSRWFGRAFVHDCRVEWAGGIEPWVDDPAPPDFGPTAFDRSVEVDWRGLTVLVPPLDLLREVNTRRGRHDRIAAIDALVG